MFLSYIVSTIANLAAGHGTRASLRDTPAVSGKNYFKSYPTTIACDFTYITVSEIFKV